MGDGTLAALKATVLWVGGSQLEMEAVRQAVGAHQAEFIALPNNANARRWLHMFESRVPLTCIVTNRTRAEDGGDMAAENLIQLIRGLSTWNTIRIMVFCSRPETLSHLVSHITRASSEINQVIRFINEHVASAGAGLTTTFRLVSDPKEIDARVRQVETYVRVLKKLMAEVKTDLDEHETLQDLRRRAIASKASMIRWLSTNSGHPDAAQVDNAVRLIEQAENDYANAAADKTSGARNASMYFRVRERGTLIPGIEHAVPVANAKARKVLMLVDKKRWAVWSKDGKDLLASIKYEDTLEIRIGRAEAAVIWRHTDGKGYGWCVTAKEQDLAPMFGELWRRVRPYRFGMNLRCIGNVLDTTDDSSTKISFNLSMDNILRVLSPISSGGTAPGPLPGKSVVIDMSNGVTISDAMPGEVMRNIVTVLTPTVTKCRFQIREKITRTFDADTELQARLWIAVLSVSAGQQPPTGSAISRSKSPLPSQRGGVATPPPTPPSGSTPPGSRLEGRTARAASVATVGSSTPPPARAMSPPRRAMAALQALPQAMLHRASSPKPPQFVEKRAPTPTSSSTSTTLPVQEAPSRPTSAAPPPSPSPISVSMPVIARTNSDRVIAPPPARPSSRVETPTTRVVEQPRVEEAKHSQPSEGSKYRTFADTVILLIGTNIEALNKFHQRLPAGALNSELLKLILDLEALQFYLKSKPELPAFLQELLAQLRQPSWVASLKQYFTCDCPSDIMQRESEEYLRPFRLFAKLQDLIKIELDSSTDLRTHKQVILNQVVEILTAVNAHLPRPQPAAAAASSAAPHPVSGAIVAQVQNPTSTSSPVRTRVAVTPPPSPASAPQGQCVQVVWGWTADGANELSVQKGEVLLLKGQPSPDWWFVASSSGEGYVPASYLKMIP